MKYYLVHPEDGEFSFSLISSAQKARGVWSLEFTGPEKNGENSQIYIRKLAGKLYVSRDGTSWKKVARVELPKEMVFCNKKFAFYRGFKPSGLSSAESGVLLTQMPGKVVKIFVKKGDKVIQGQTLLVLEAMKMENEIKAGKEGVIKEVHVKEGQALDSGVLMIEVDEGPHE